MTTTINLTINCTAVPADEPRIRAAVERILTHAKVRSAQVGIAVLTDAAIRQLNKQYLNHDYATDAISFVLERKGGHLEGEIAVSAETAQREAARLGWAAADELLLYIVHGALHLVGEDDLTESGAAIMRRREREVLAEFGLVPPWEDRPDQPSGKTMPSGKTKPSGQTRSARKSQRSRKELTR